MLICVQSVLKELIACRPEVVHFITDTGLRHTSGQLFIAHCLSLSLSILKTIFQVNLGYPVFIEATADGGGGDKWTTGAISRAKLQSNHHHQQTNIQFFYRPDALPVTQPTMSKHWRENITFHGLVYLKLTWGLPALYLTTNSSLLPWGGLPCLSSALWCQFPNFDREEP